MYTSKRADLESLLQEVQAIELLAEEADIRPDGIQDYWSVTADLVALVLDIEELQRSPSSADEETLQKIRRRLRDISARLGELTLDED